MFNLKKHSQTENFDLLGNELKFFGIHHNADGYEVAVGDENVKTHSLSECKKYILDGTQELKQYIWDKWQELQQVAFLIAQSNSSNKSRFDNLLFLNNVKKAIFLSHLFEELEETSQSLESVLNVDATIVPDRLIKRFNRIYLQVRLAHQLIMSELYKIKVINQYSKNVKKAQISGPWANLDLPMKERVFEWGEDEEYFDLREKARKEQTRYNPENLLSGFFFVWQDLNMGPYSFENVRKMDTPYKSRMLLQIP